MRNRTAEMDHLGWAPRHGEEHVEGYPQLLCTVNMAICWGVGYDCLQNPMFSKTETLD